MKSNAIHNSTAPSASSRAPRPELPSAFHKPLRRRVEARLQSVIGAGSVVFRRRSGRAEVFFVKNSYGRWTFPKGKQQLGESLAQTAVRETFEEAGLKGMRLIAPLGRTAFRFRQQGKLIQKTVYFFLFEAPTDAKEHMTGVEGGMWEAMWVQANKAILVNGYRNLDLLLSKALRIIAQSSHAQPPRTGSGYGRTNR